MFKRWYIYCKEFSNVCSTIFQRSFFEAKITHWSYLIVQQHIFINQLWVFSVLHLDLLRSLFEFLFDFASSGLHLWFFSEDCPLEKGVFLFSQRVRNAWEFKSLGQNLANNSMAWKLSFLTCTGNNSQVDLTHPNLYVDQAESYSVGLCLKPYSCLASFPFLLGILHSLMYFSLEDISEKFTLHLSQVPE